MSVQTADYLDLITRLPPGGRLTLYEIAWDEYAQLLDQEILSYGSTTLKLKPKRKGAEGDDCFYIQRAGQIGEKDNLDLRIDPPPDLVIEIDVTRDSSGKFGIYAALGVPEIWRYDGSRFSIWQLDQQAYSPLPFSLAFPFLTAEHLDEFVADSEAHGSKQA